MNLNLLHLVDIGNESEDKLNIGDGREAGSLVPA